MVGCWTEGETLSGQVIHQQLAPAWAPSAGVHKSTLLRDSTVSRSTFSTKYRSAGPNIEATKRATGYPIKPMVGKG